METGEQALINVRFLNLYNLISLQRQQGDSKCFTEDRKAVKYKKKTQGNITRHTWIFFHWLNPGRSRCVCMGLTWCQVSPWCHRIWAEEFPDTHLSFWETRLQGEVKKVYYCPQRMFFLILLPMIAVSDLLLSDNTTEMVQVKSHISNVTQVKVWVNVHKY